MARLVTSFIPFITPMVIYLAFETFGTDPKAKHSSHLSVMH